MTELVELRAVRAVSLVVAIAITTALAAPILAMAAKIILA
jgi:hypothetical protein